MGKIQDEIRSLINKKVGTVSKMQDAARAALELIMFYFEPTQDYKADQDSITPNANPTYVSGIIQWFEKDKLYLYDLAAVGALKKLTFENIYLEKIEDRSKLHMTGNIFQDNLSFFDDDVQRGGEGISLLVMDTKTDIYTSYDRQFNALVDKLNLISDDFQTRSILIVPMIYGQRPIGVINLESTKENFFHEGDQDFLTNIAQRVAVLLIATAETERSEQNKLSRYISVEIGRATSFNELAEIALGEIKKYYSQSTAVIKGSIRWLTPDGKSHAPVSGDPFVEGGERLLEVRSHEQGGNSLTGHVAATGKYIFAEDLSDLKWEGRFYRAYGDEMLSELVVPVIDKDKKVVGVINLEATKTLVFRHEDVYFLEAIADQMVLAKEVTELRKQQENVAIRGSVEFIESFLRDVLHQTKNEAINEVNVNDVTKKLTERDTEEDLKLAKKLKLATKNAGKLKRNLISWYDMMVMPLIDTENPLKRFEINGAIHYAIQEACEEAENKYRINLIVDFISSDMIYVEANSALTTIFEELLVNAVKYRRDHTIEAKVYIRTTVTSENVRISFKDDGRGIPLDALEAIFQSDVRLVNIGERKESEFDSTGRGLFIAWYTITKLKGTIIATSSGLDKGSTFTITLPLYKGEK